MHCGVSGVLHRRDPIESRSGNPLSLAETEKQEPEPQNGLESPAWCVAETVFTQGSRRWEFKVSVSLLKSRLRELRRWADRYTRAERMGMTG